MSAMKPVMKCTFHLFGVAGEPSLICPESIALFWVLNKHAKDTTQYEVVFSNNTDLSPVRELPLLVVSEGNDDGSRQSLAGFTDIIQYLIENDHIEGATSMSLDAIAALQFLSTDFKCMTLYQLYLNKSGYTKYTRKQFSKLLYWPAWYTTPLQIRSTVRDLCNETLQLEYLPIDEEELQELSSSKEEEAITLESELAQSKSLQLSQMTKRNKLDELKSFKHQLQYCNKLGELLQSWQDLTHDIQVDSTVLQILEIYYIANLYIQITLPDNDSILKCLKQNLKENEVTEIVQKSHTYSTIDNKLTIREPTFTEQGNITMSVYHKLKSYTSY
ncbi:sorting assembly machinery 37 kDa subunit [Monosporozyma servazzii]